MCIRDSSYLYDQRDGRHRLYLGEYCTIAGMKLFPDNPVASHIKIYGDYETRELSSAENMRISALISYLSDDYTGLVDFSCLVDPDCNFSTHDDGECSFDSGTEDLIRVLVERVAPPVYSDHLWKTLKSNRGCYITIDETMQFTVYTDFRSMVDATSA